MKKIVMILLVAFVACGLAFAGASGQKVVKIGISVPTADHGWTGGVGWWTDTMVNQISDQYKGQVDFRVAHAANPTQQVGDLDTLMTWGMNYLVVLPHESAPLAQPIKAIAGKGVKIIICDRGIPEPAGFGNLYVAGDNYGMGKFSGQWLSKTMVAENLVNFVCIGGIPTVIDTERMTGFFEEMDKAPNLVNLQGGHKYEFGNWSQQKGLEIMQTFLQQYPKIDAVFCQDDDILLGVMQAIREARRTDVKIVLGGAGSKIVYKMIIDKDPLVRADVLYNPSMIKDAIQAAVDLATGKRLDNFSKGTTTVKQEIPSGIVDASNVMQYYNPDSAF
jgi:ribose transport system substrate-binding protein